MPFSPSPSRRKKILVSGLCACLGLLASCGSPSPSGTERSAKGGDGELRVIIPVEPQGLDPNDLRGEGVLSVAPSLFNKLVMFDTDFQLLPDLARSWKVSDGGLAYTFELRPDVTWHDGRPFTAADVRWTFERQPPPAERNLAQNVLLRIERVETPGDHTVIFRLREPWAPFLSALASEGACILPRPASGGKTAPDPSRNPVGTGPFRFREWVKGDHLTLDANPHYFRPGPFVDRITFRFEKDFSRGSELLLSGAADLFAGRPDPSAVLRLSTDRRLQILTVPSSGRFYLGFNFRRPLLQDLRVREALNRALDRRRLVSRALLGFGVPALGFYTPAVEWAYDEEAKVPAFDPAAAAALLDAAGLRPGSGGVRLRLRLLGPDLAPFPALAEEIRLQLAPLGIEIEPEILPYAEWFQNIMTKHDFDLALMAGSQGPDPENLSVRFGSRGYSQFMGYSSPELDAAVAEGARTVDLARRAEAYFRAQRILARDLPIAPLAEAVQLAIIRRGLRGLPQTDARGLVPVNDYSLVRRESLP